MNLILLRKCLFFIGWYLIWLNMFPLILTPEIYYTLHLLLVIVIVILIGLLDTIFRSFEEEATTIDKYTAIILCLFLGAPFLLILSYYENKFFVSLYFSQWNSFGVILIPIGIALTILGGVITVTGRYQLGKFATGTLQILDDHQLMTSGIYRFIRHPIYGGGIIGAIGIQLCFQTIIMAIIYPLIYFFVLNKRLVYEEMLLEQHFGEKYTQYKKTTKKMIPFLY